MPCALKTASTPRTPVWLLAKKKKFAQKSKIHQSEVCSLPTSPHHEMTCLRNPSPQHHTNLHFINQLNVTYFFSF
jgi:hypothetical protein